MCVEARLQEVERKVTYIVEFLSSFTYGDAIAELGKRVVALEERFDESSFNLDGSIRNVYIKQEALFKQKKKNED